MKKLTVNEVAKALMENTSMECENHTTGRYYLHIFDNGEISERRTEETTTFTEDVDISEWADDESPDRFYNEFETLDNDDFRYICAKLTDQANHYLEKWGVDPKIIELFANYGCLAAEKRIVYTWGNPADGVGYDKIKVELPEGWDYGFTMTGDMILTSPEGWDYPINDILCGNDDPTINAIDRRNGADNFIALKVVK